MQQTTIVLTISYDPEKFFSSPEYWDWSSLVGLSNTQLVVNSVHVKPVDGAEFTTEVLASLMWGSQEFSLRTPRSVDLRDHPIERVKCLPHNIGKLLAEADPEGNQFHIEWYPSEGVAEVWSKRAWENSLTKRLKHVTGNDSDVARRNRLRSELRFHFAKTAKCGSEQAEKLADLIINFGDANDFLLDTFQAPETLKQQLKDYRGNRTSV